MNQEETELGLEIILPMIEKAKRENKYYNIKTGKLITPSAAKKFENINEEFKIVIAKTYGTKFNIVLRVLQHERDCQCAHSLPKIESLNTKDIFWSGISAVHRQNYYNISSDKALTPEYIKKMTNVNHKYKLVANKGDKELFGKVISAIDKCKWVSSEIIQSKGTNFLDKYIEKFENVGVIRQGIIEAHKNNTYYNLGTKECIISSEKYSNEKYKLTANEEDKLFFDYIVSLLEKQDQCFLIPESFENKVRFILTYDFYFNELLSKHVDEFRTMIISGHQKGRYLNVSSGKLLTINQVKNVNEKFRLAASVPDKETFDYIISVLEYQDNCDIRCDKLIDHFVDKLLPKIPDLSGANISFDDLVKIIRDIITNKDYYDLNRRATTKYCDLEEDIKNAININNGHETFYKGEMWLYYEYRIICSKENRDFLYIPLFNILNGKKHMDQILENMKIKDKSGTNRKIEDPNSSILKNDCPELQKEKIIKSKNSPSKILQENISIKENVTKDKIESVVVPKKSENNISKSTSVEINESSLNVGTRNSTKKQSISSKTREKVWEIHIGDSMKGKCYCCDDPIKFSSAGWHCGHILAESKGGNITIDNLRPVCAGCNLSMGTMHMKDFFIQNGFKGKGAKEFMKK